MVRTVLNDLMINRDRLATLQQQLSSGFTINRPSDDPGGTVTVMQARSTIAEIEQFRTNALLGEDWLRATESVLNEVSDALSRLRELAIRGAGDTLPDGSRYAVGQEIEGIVDHLLSLANTRHAGRYLFAGHHTRTEPMSLEGDEIVYAGDDGALEYEVGPGIRLTVNVAGDRVFMDMLDTGLSVGDAVREGNNEEIDGLLEEIDAAEDEVLAVRAQLGGRINRLELSQRRLEETELSMTRLISHTRDADMAELLMRLANAEQAYQVSLATGARILPPTLLDYLR